MWRGDTTIYHCAVHVMTCLTYFFTLKCQNVKNLKGRRSQESQENNYWFVLMASLILVLPISIQHPVPFTI